MPVIEDLIYLKFTIVPPNANNANNKIDEFDGIIGGLGISYLNRNKLLPNINDRLRNCILFCCQQTDMIEVIQSSYVSLVYNRCKFSDKDRLRSFLNCSGVCKVRANRECVC